MRRRRDRQSVRRLIAGNIGNEPRACREGPTRVAFSRWLATPSAGCASSISAGRSSELQEVLVALRDWRHTNIFNRPIRIVNRLVVVPSRYLAAPNNHRMHVPTDTRAWLFPERTGERKNDLLSPSVSIHDLRAMNSTSESNVRFQPLLILGDTGSAPNAARHQETSHDARHEVG